MLCAIGGDQSTGSGRNLRGGVCMKKRGLFDSPEMTRREALGRVAVTSIGVASVLSGAGAMMRTAAQAPADVTPTPPPATDPNFPMPPTWKRELRQLAPNVYAFVQGGG